jgi:hypothetical protein
MVILRPITVSESITPNKEKEKDKEKEKEKIKIGCSIPCHLCRKQLVDMDFTIHAVTNLGTWFHGKLTDEAAPPSKFTHGQVKIKEKENERK